MTLTEISYYSRRIVPFVFLGLVFIIVFYLLIKSAIDYVESRKVIPLFVDPIYGKVTKIVRGEKLNYPDGINFTLDNIEGRPVTATQSAKVFFLPPKTTRIGYLQSAYLLAKNLGFDTEVVRHESEDTNAIFKDDRKKLVIDVANFNFEYRYFYEDDKATFRDPVIPDESRIKENIKEFLRLVGRYPEELSQGRENLIYLAYHEESNDFVTVAKPEEANAVELDFFRPDIDGFATVAPRYYSSQDYVVATFNDGEFQVIKAQIKFFEKEDQRYGVYPIKSGETAYQDLQQKKGFVVAQGTAENSIVIKKMFLGYYDPDIYQKYLQPVYVFLGDNGFAAYVPAIRDEYIE